MKRSTDRILVTHTGSLARPPELLKMIVARTAGGENFDQAAFDAAAREAVADAVRRQVEAGLDIVNDGEMSRHSFHLYVRQRLTGFTGGPMPRRESLDAQRFPKWAAGVATQGPATAGSNNGPIDWQDFGDLEKDIANLKAAVAAVSPQPTEVFMTSVSPGTLVNNMPTTYFPSSEAYALAMAEALKREYKAIVDAGFVLQVDAPDLGLYDTFYPHLSIEEFRGVAEMYVEAINVAIDDLPADRIRLHICWGAGERPSYRNIPLASIVDVVLKANVGAISFMGANGHHEHEYHVWETARLPAGMTLIPGVVDSTTNIVEHPEVVAERLQRYAERVGKENVIAGVDCGFGTSATMAQVDGDVAYAKLAALAAGAKLASERLWGTSATASDGPAVARA